MAINNSNNGLPMSNNVSNSAYPNNSGPLIEGTTDSRCGFTALHFASYHGNPKMIDLLVENGANVYATNK